MEMMRDSTPPINQPDDDRSSDASHDKSNDGNSSMLTEDSEHTTELLSQNHELEPPQGRWESVGFSSEFKVKLHHTNKKYKYAHWKYSIKGLDKPEVLRIDFNFNCDLTTSNDVYDRFLQMLTDFYEDSVCDRIPELDWMGTLTWGKEKTEHSQSGHISIVEGSSTSSKRLFHQLNLAARQSINQSINQSPSPSRILASDGTKWCLVLSDPCLAFNHHIKNDYMNLTFKFHCQEIRDGSAIPDFFPSPLIVAGAVTGAVADAMNTAVTGDMSDAMDIGMIDTVNSAMTAGVTDTTTGNVSGGVAGAMPGSMWSRRRVMLNIHMYRAPVDQIPTQMTDVITDRLQQFHQSFFDRCHGVMVCQRELKEPDYRYQPESERFVYQPIVKNNTKLWYQLQSVLSDSQIAQRDAPVSQSINQSADDSTSTNQSFYRPKMRSTSQSISQSINQSTSYRNSSSHGRNREEKSNEPPTRADANKWRR